MLTTYVDFTYQSTEEKQFICDLKKTTKILFTLYKKSLLYILYSLNVLQELNPCLSHLTLDKIKINNFFLLDRSDWSKIILHFCPFKTKVQNRTKQLAKMLICAAYSCSQSRQVLSFFSSRRHWDSPNPSPAGEYAPPPFGPGVGAHSLAREGGWESPNSDEETYNVALLCTMQLCLLVLSKTERSFHV